MSESFTTPTDAGSIEKSEAIEKHIEKNLPLNSPKKGFGECVKGGKHIFLFAKCKKCGKPETEGLSPAPRRKKYTSIADIENDIESIKQDIQAGEYSRAAELPALQQKLDKAKNKKIIAVEESEGLMLYKSADTFKG